MKDIKVLDPGCKRCQTTEDMVKAAASALGIEASVEKIIDYAEMAKYARLTIARAYGQRCPFRDAHCPFGERQSAYR